ncbi:MAG: S46 family peptidase [Bacteroidales bacterium]|nr:S46 family peptidase [Bacteroidales bacterium]MEE0991824.1 S46 family peptidase [Bacteroidales bacterium]
MKRVLIFGALLLSIVGKVIADEGMWLPLLLADKQADMQKNGMKITAEDIYSANKSSLKDAVVLFGRGCTGEFVSSEGLLLTNHHCGYGSIVRHSTVEHDYLTNGFWAKNKQEELPCAGMSVTLLVYMKDVTNEVLQGVGDNISEEEREKLIERNIAAIRKKATEGTHYEAVIKPFYYGNQYFMYVNEVFNDVRLVGAPPSNIGKFGGDTDNWMWPRHTGDFSMFRVYADKDNKPAGYSEDNVPYVPKRHLRINLKGAQEGDFTFVFGYPGTTKQFLTSDAVDFVQNMDDPIRIKLRTIRLDVYNRAMNESPAQRLRYASQVASVANGWKKWQGEVRGLKRLNAVDKKKAFERDFESWAADKGMYRNVLPMMRETYSAIRDLNLQYTYLSEAVLVSDLMHRAKQLSALVDYAKKGELDKANLEKTITEGYVELQKHYSNDYANHRRVDKEIFIRTMSVFYNDYAKDKYAWLKDIVVKQYDNNPEAYFDEVYENSLLSNPAKAEKILKNFKAKQIKKLENDPAIELFANIWTQYAEKDRFTLAALDTKLDSLYRVYVDGIMKKDNKKEFYPDANLTLRVAYGNIKTYEPKDGIEYKAFSTIEGIMEKENPEIYDYVVEKKLKDLYLAKDYGPYANEKGEMPVAFIASNHTTGGNSGSPVLDANGDLIGINFDRNWEGTMSDVMYDPSQCRNISLDIRYCLFIIDKFAGAKHLVDEMTIVK